jgi:hypothetical protein
MESGPWRKSTCSANEANCVELSNTGAVRDSKNPAGTILRVDLTTLINAIKAGSLDR